jgi:hypothetical protein
MPYPASSAFQNGVLDRLSGPTSVGSHAIRAKMISNAAAIAQGRAGQWRNLVAAT